MTRSLMLFEPFDTVMFRDGRPFDGGLSTLATSGLPTPSTITAAASRALGSFPRAVAGPMVVTAGLDNRWYPLYPAPLDVVRLPETDGGGAEIGRLGWPGRVQVHPEVEHLAPEGVTAPSGRGDSLQRQLLLSTQMERWLKGDLPFDQMPTTSPVAQQQQVGLARGHDGMLYTASFLRLADRTRFAALVETDEPPTLTSADVPLGGEGRMAHVELHDANLLHTPDPPTIAGDNPELLVTLATPAIFAKGWLPPRPDGADLIAACTGQPQPITHGRAPNWRLDWAVPPGSTYLFRFRTAKAAEQFAAERHFTCLKQSNKSFRTAGYGLCLIGVRP